MRNLDVCEMTEGGGIADRVPIVFGADILSSGAAKPRGSGCVEFLEANSWRSFCLSYMFSLTLGC